MKLSETWLREWVNPNIDIQTLANQLTMAGLEVDAVTHAAPKFSGVVIGYVQKRIQHPDADRLSICTVDIGADELQEIVCGGVNVCEGLKVAVAAIGAVLPGNFAIKKAKLRGVMSHGMICSSKELGLGEDQCQGGIMELPSDAPVGQDFREYFQLNDHIIDIELTPNRGDCASIRGVSREVALFNDVVRTPVQDKKIKATSKTLFPIELKAPKKCARYVGRVIENININASTPLWMLERLRRANIRAIHPVVDVCNYVMLELGQPMHGFDLAKFKNKIVIREALQDEEITLLDEQKIKLNAGTLVIADEHKPQAIAGIMGGFDSAVDANTTHVFLESAFFDPIHVRLDARQYALQTDSSYRFERGVDYQLQIRAIERATELLLEITGGQAGPVIEKISEPDLPKAPRVKLRRSEILRMLGIEMSDQQVESIFKTLEFEFSANQAGWEVVAPSHRFDIAIEADLIEELARIYGYQNIPTVDFVAPLIMPQSKESQLSHSRMAAYWVDRGYREVITYSFVNSKLQNLICPQSKAIALVNPITSDMDVMRTSLWPGLLNSLVHNQNRQIPRVKFFEMGMCFSKVSQGIEQVSKLAGIISGSALPLQWGAPTRSADFFDLKGDLEALFAFTGCSDKFDWQRSQHPALHPGQSADIYQNGHCVGHLGALHPRISQQIDLNRVPLLFEINLSVIENSLVPSYHEISKFPQVRRDLALVIDENIETTQLVKLIYKESGKLLSNVQIFDIYQGENIESGKKSIALGLTFQDPSRTLVDEEINQVIQSVVSTLERAFNAKLRA